MIRTVGLWGPVILVMAVIFCISSLPDAPLPEGMSDKTGHTLGYTLLGLTVVRAMAGGLPRRITWSVALTAIAITTGYGALDEVHQRFVPGRTASAGDLLADASGAAIGTALCWAWGIIAPASASPGSRHDL